MHTLAAIRPPACMAKVLSRYARAVLSCSQDLRDNDFQVTCVKNSPTMPEQTNGYDCGIFMFYNFISHALHYACGAPLIHYQQSDCHSLRKHLVHCCITGAPLPSWLVQGHHNGIIMDSHDVATESLTGRGSMELEQRYNSQSHAASEPHFDINVRWAGLPLQVLYAYTPDASPS